MPNRPRQPARFRLLSRNFMVWRLLTHGLSLSLPAVIDRFAGSITHLFHQPRPTSCQALLWTFSPSGISRFVAASGFSNESDL